METVIKTNTWTCINGHAEKAAQDLGDPADAEQINRLADDIYFGGCRSKVNGKRCGKRCHRTSSEHKEYG